MSVAKIKNAKGEYESIPALRDRSGYEAAKANGYTGTEEEWINDIFSNGWVGAVQELNNNKASNADLNEVKDDIKDINETLSTSIPPWNLNENIGDICNGSGLYISIRSTVPNGLYPGRQVKGVAIPMIHSGKIRLKCTEVEIDNKSATTTNLYNPQTTFVKIYLNYNLLYELYFDGTRSLDEDLSWDIDVAKGDALSIIVSAENTGGGSTDLYDITSTIAGVKIYANIETPFVYMNLDMFDPENDEYVENPSTTEILDTLMSTTS